MKHVPCTIEILHDTGEDCWCISVSAGHAAEAALEFAALHLGCSERIVFADKDQRFTIRSNAVTFGQRTVAVDKNWLEAVWRLFLDTHRDGWTNTAHIDQDFSDSHGDLCITIRLAPPA